MEIHEANQLTAIVDDIADDVTDILERDECRKLKENLAKISSLLARRFSVTLDINVQIYDPERDRALPLLQTGLSTNDGGEPYQVWGDATLQRYFVNGTATIVPHDHCPGCWGRWGAKTVNTSCPDCGIAMGTDVKWLLDSDLCPYCEQGTVTLENTTCQACGNHIEPSWVVWG